MIRKTTINLNYANTGKLGSLDDVIHEYNRVVNGFIDYLWDNNLKSGKFVRDTKWLETWLSARLTQAAAKQALAIVKSQRKKKKQTKPIFCRLVMELDSRFVTICQDMNTFDFWIRLSSLGQKIILWIPSKKHRHFRKFADDGWEMGKSVRIRKTDKGFFADIFFEKSEPGKKPFGRVVGIDIGYKKLIADSRKRFYGKEFGTIAEKISRKKQGSKGFKKALAERDAFVSHVTKGLSLKGVRAIVIEDLKDVKRGSKGKIRKSFNNKLQRWTYPKVIAKLERMCEEGGVRLIRVNPAYTSQTCCRCLVRDKSARNGELFVCNNPKCRNYRKPTDADTNSAMNMRRKGHLVSGKETVPARHKGGVSGIRKTGTRAGARSESTAKIIRQNPDPEEP